MKKFKTEYKNNPQLFACLPKHAILFSYLDQKLLIYYKCKVVDTIQLSNKIIAKTDPSQWVKQKLQISLLAGQSILTSHQLMFQIGSQLFVFDRQFHLQILNIPFFYNFESQNFIFHFKDKIFVSNNASLFILDGSQLRKTSYVTVNKRFFQFMNRVFIVGDFQFAELFDDFSIDILFFYSEIKIIGLFELYLVFVEQNQTFVFDILKKVKQKIEFDHKNIVNNFDVGEFGFKLKKKIQPEQEIDVSEFWEDKKAWSQNIELLMEINLNDHEEIVINEITSETETYDDESDDI